MHLAGETSRFCEQDLNRVIAVVVTRDRPALLRFCLNAVLSQDRAPDEVVVVDNASGPETAAVLAGFPSVEVIRLASNEGGAGGFHAGLKAALGTAADWLWVMDDDGRPQRTDCLARLLRRARSDRAELVGPLVVDVDRPDRLAFPIRINGHTLFETADLVAHGPVRGFVHLFNGALIGRKLLERVGLPDRRLFIRGDEVEFFLRARHSGTTIVLETEASFLHPGSAAEIHPIFGGLYYAIVPEDPVKKYFQFRNRAYIFAKHRMWLWLGADFVRYGYYFLVTGRGDLSGLAAWTAATLQGLFRPPSGADGIRLALAHNRRYKLGATGRDRPPALAKPGPMVPIAWSWPEAAGGVARFGAAQAPAEPVPERVVADPAP